MLNLRLNIVIQGINFVVIPLVFLCVALLFSHADFFSHGILDGLILLGTQPTTISSCVMLTLSAGGDETLAIANSIGGNVLGVIITPVLTTFLIDLLASVLGVSGSGSGSGSGSNGSVNIGSIFLKLGTTIILPTAVGVVFQIMVPKAPVWLKAHVPISYINQFILLSMIYTTFCDTFSTDLDLVRALASFCPI